MFTDTDRGQVGIGTLIVFIAMVLVAAIAAGVLINTAGLLQSQAEATGQETAEQVSDRVDVISVIGSGENEEIESLDVNVRRGAGSGDINLEDATVEVFASGQSAVLTFDDGNAGENTFDVEMTEGDNFVLSDSSDRAAIEVNLDEAAETLSPGQSVTLQITTAAGGSAFVEKRAPSNIDDDPADYRL